MQISILDRLDARDRALFARCALGLATPAATRRWWTAVTHLGGIWCSLALATVPLLFDGPLRMGARHALLVLVVSHLVVQLIKRTVGRARPSRTLFRGAHVGEPDVFSFPSGHATAAMSVAIGYGLAFPTLAPALVALAVMAGFSRVFLGVHYPGDVVAGQGIAILTALLAARA